MTIAKQKVVALVLAAGEGKRLGGPKALLAWPDPRTSAPRPLAIAHAEERLDAESGRAIVVVRKAVVGVLIRFVRPGIDLLVSDAPDALGPAGSIAAAVSRLDDAEVVILTPVDAVPAKPAIVARLLERLERDPKLLAVRAIHRGKGGHPVVARRAVLDRYLEADPPPLRDRLRALGEACADEECPDASVLIDLDRPSDVMGVLEALPTFVR